MTFIIKIMVIFMALEHFAFLYLEMFLWTKKLGRKIFSNSREEAKASKILAANQGLYNGVLAIGLLWGLFYAKPVASGDVVIFFLSAIVVLGLYGGFTAKRTIIYIQAIPALITLILVLMKN